MNTELVNNNSDSLIIFLTGWGCDSNQFRFMFSEKRDILIVYDYTDLSFDFDFSKYKKFYLVTFSAGVFMGGMLQNMLPKFEKTVMINGSVYPYDKEYGMSKKTVEVFKNVTIETALEFRREYLVYDEDEFRLFNKYNPRRSAESCHRELESLIGYDKTNPEPMEYDVAYISDSDKIFNPEMQQEFWKKRSKVVMLKNSAHFPFGKIKNFDLFIDEKI